MGHPEKMKTAWFSFLCKTFNLLPKTPSYGSRLEILSSVLVEAEFALVV